MRSLLACCLVLLAVGLLAAVADARVLGSRTLQAGMTGSDVRSLQVGLTHRGYRVPATGKFGAQTYAAVVRFQRAHHLTADGVVGPATLRALRGGRHSAPSHGSSSSYSFGSRVLKAGMLGSDVRVLQLKLTNRGYRVPASGKFGAFTYSAVTRF